MMRPNAGVRLVADAGCRKTEPSRTLRPLQILHRISWPTAVSLSTRHVLDLGPGHHRRIGSNQRGLYCEHMPTAHPSGITARSAAPPPSRPPPPTSRRSACRRPGVSPPHAAAFQTPTGFKRSCLALPSKGAPDTLVQDTHFSCAHARAAFDRVGGSSYLAAKVPLKNGATAESSSAPWRRASSASWPYLVPDSSKALQGNGRETSWRLRAVELPFPWREA
jgi:hypothetical protein